MASDDSDQDARYALSKLLKRGTVAKYESEFLMLIKRVTGILESLLNSFYISGLKPLLQCALLSIEEKIDIVLSWPSEEAPPVIKGSIDANEDAFETPPVAVTVMEDVRIESVDEDVSWEGSVISIRFNLGEPNILATSGNDLGITIYGLGLKDEAIKMFEDNYQSLGVKMRCKDRMHKSQHDKAHKCCANNLS
ncbi:hypothetical protein Tco_1414732 [Tanacetum coccineum]